MDFIPLHTHSCYTFLQSAVKLDAYVENAIKNGYKTIGISDVGVLYGYPEFNKLAKKAGINPIFGMDLVCNENTYSLFVKDETGYSNLCKISTFLENNNGICESLDTIKDYVAGLICVISTKSSKVFEHVNENVFKDTLYKIQKYFPDFYIGLEIYDVNDKQKAHLIREFANHYSYSTIAFPFICTLEKGFSATLAMLTAVKEETNVETIEDNIPVNNYLRDNKEIASLYDYKDIKELNDLVDKINFNFSVKRGKMLHFSEDKNVSSYDLLKEEIYKGLKEKNIDIKTNKRYRDRLNKEFIIIDKMGYLDYFLIVQDYVRYAHDSNFAVSPGRGSVAGCLIAYLLGITDIDPLKFDGLLFERFLNPERKSMPDIDMDFGDRYQSEIIKYIRQKYGENRTARVIAFQTFGAKQAIRDAGKVYRFDSLTIDQLSSSIPKNFNNNNYDLNYCYETIPAFKELVRDEKTKQLFELAKKIEGFPRQKGIHAAGVIVNDSDLNGKIPLSLSSEGEAITQYDKDYIEDQGFLKMDVLSVTALTTIQNAISLIKETKGIDFTINSIPYDTPETFNVLNSGLTIGIFQLDTAAASAGLNQIKPKSFNEVVDLLALDRPGPMEQIPHYVLRKEGKEQINYLDKSLIPILKNTYGILIYQEQIMQICRTFAGFSYAEADIFRRAISKKDKTGLEKMREKFITSSIKNKKDKVVAERIFDLINKFAEYGFNKSHSIAYSMVSCKMAYLKAHFPLEYYCSVLQSQYGSNDTKFSNYVSEIKKVGLKLYGPNVNESTRTFRIYNGGLLMPLSNIGGIPFKIFVNIIEEREAHGKFTSFIEFVTRMMNTKDKITELQLNKLIEAGCFDSLHENRKELKLSAESAINYASNSIYQDGKLLDSFGLSFTVANCDEDKKERILSEIDVLGVAVTDSLFNYIKKPENIRYTPFDKLVVRVETYVIGIVTNTKSITIKNGLSKGKQMAYVDIIDDRGDTLNLTLFPESYDKYFNSLEKDIPIQVKGKFNNTKGKKSFIVDEILILEGI
ncbi:MAG: DNA polymerase III subunit alpha [Bacilli bacterium]|nr:DNA polymerase III subunit alpha [Bacilli bacterium]